MSEPQRFDKLNEEDRLELLNPDVECARAYFAKRLNDALAAVRAALPGLEER